jgi:hypothetical protein
MLRVQGWEVFRIGNWELKDDVRRKKVLDELREFMDFDTPPIDQSKKIVIPKRSVPPQSTSQSPRTRSPIPQRNVPVDVPKRVVPATRAVPSRTPQRNPLKYVPGTRIKHGTFGVGTVVSSRLVEGDEEVTVGFADRERRLLASFAKFKILPPEIGDDELPF